MRGELGRLHRENLDLLAREGFAGGQRGGNPRRNEGPCGGSGGSAKGVATGNAHWVVPPGG